MSVRQNETMVLLRKDKMRHNCAYQCIETGGLHESARELECATAKLIFTCQYLLVKVLTPALCQLGTHEDLQSLSLLLVRANLG